MVCSGCGRAGSTRDEAADLAVDWLVVDISTDPAPGIAHIARFHQACRPAGVPGELACAGCGDGPLLDPTLTAVLAGAPGAVDLFTAAALTGWLDAHGWTGDPHLVAGPAAELEDPDAGEGPRCPACSPRPTWSRTSAAVGAAR
ncbi:hypothetical protein [Actinomycetospora soli]|uniref:hypothetical protein n=1 Tax=Actinomycetospora soli TaxID=2893887 RepID=UPI001E638C88|nr:hypothetical protein [Actinomycetospora soli]